ncbi:hypothetical protein JTB14_010112 [Gonioctena quinquepunctata]|nr:hypothetical protein JTB14_010112 [Gonioctena quinquepunctata]
MGRKVMDGKSKGLSIDLKRTKRAIICKCTGKTFHCKSVTKTKIVQRLLEVQLEGEKNVLGKCDSCKSRDRNNENISRRKLSFKYHLNVNKSKIRVCKKTLLATLGIGEWMVNNWLEDGAEEHEELSGEDETGNKKHSKKVTRQKDLNERLSFYLRCPK